jgi:hypothetical protein
MSNYTEQDQAIIKVLAFLGALYPKFELTQPTIKAYLTILRDIPLELLEKAALDLGSRATFFPSAAELRQAAFDLQDGANGVPSAGEAWGQVCAVWRGRNKEELPAIIHRAVEAMGGWRQLGLSENQMADRAHFLKVYEVLLERQRSDMRMLPQVQNYVAQLAAGNSAARVMAGINSVTEKLAVPVKHINQNDEATHD